MVKKGLVKTFGSSVNELCDLQEDLCPFGGLRFCVFKTRKVSLDDHNFLFTLDVYDSGVL